MSDVDAARWTRVAERGSLLGMRITLACYRLFGRPLSTVLVHAVVGYFYGTDRAGRAASRAYLGRIAAHPSGAEALGRLPGRWASFLHYRAFALSIFDRMVMWLDGGKGIEYEVTGRTRAQSILDSTGRGAIVLGAHLGSFDALRALAQEDRRTVNVLMYTRHAPRINSLFRRIDPDVDVRVIDAAPGSARAVFAIRECIERGELVAILGDRVEPSDRGRTCSVPLLGDPVELPQAPYLLAGLLRCPLFLWVAVREGPGRYRVCAEVLSERVELPREERDKRIGELAAAYAGRLEEYCLRWPYQWFNFFDVWERRSP